MEEVGNGWSAYLTELRDKAYNDAKEKGFHDKEYSDEHWLMLIVCEIAEAVEADRRGEHADMNAYETNIRCGEKPDVAFCRHVKDTVEDELADVCIRTLDFMGLRNLSVPNKFEREVRHANRIKEEFCTGFSDAAYLLFLSVMLDPKCFVLANVFSLCQIMSIDILRHVQLKMEYNRTRPRLHGKRY